ncbi:transposase [Candidatus Mycolicibacterium alkanivorans]|uniref:Transposase n=1 Tax=Candidatus Mycolicibacterium alkanivorans TaxID=2954114 RepID=A0ABS9YUY8_9MYCO|nr:transposase [Candidatus Mycolicibacterium alkanivorans]
MEPHTPPEATTRRSAIDYFGLSSGRHEGLNTKVRLLIRRAYGFHSAEAALALVLPACGPVTLELPYRTGHHPHSWQ